MNLSRSPPSVSCSRFPNLIKREQGSLEYALKKLISTRE
jgi:hypothetical protein